MSKGKRIRHNHRIEHQNEPLPTLKMSGVTKLTNNKKKPVRVIDSARSKYNPVECQLSGKR